MSRKNERKLQNSIPSDHRDGLPPWFDPGAEEDPAALEVFRRIIWDHYHEHGRDFPWRNTADPYRILLSEMMLQQTQTHRVLPKYEQILSLWPTFGDLAEASLTDVLSAWKGLGYNRRALALKRIAEISSSEYGGSLPDDQKKLLELPMVGPATSAAVLAFCYGRPSLYLETNIRRVLIHFFYHDEQKVHDRDLYRLLELLVDREDPRSWYYAFMDYGVYLKGLIPNPNRRSAHYSRQAKFENSNRQIRGELLTVFTEHGASTLEELYQFLSFDRERIDSCLAALEKEGFLTCEQAAETSPLYRIS